MSEFPALHCRTGSLYTVLYNKGHLEDIIPEVEAGAGLPLGGVLEKFVEIMPVTLIENKLLF